jgi:hypothetical protein
MGRNMLRFYHHQNVLIRRHPRTIYVTHFFRPGSKYTIVNYWLDKYDTFQNLMQDPGALHRSDKESPELSTWTNK